MRLVELLQVEPSRPRTVRACSTQPTLLVPLANGMYQNQPVLEDEDADIALFPPGPAPRRRGSGRTAPPCRGPAMGCRRPCREARKASRPLASTRKRARTCASRRRRRASRSRPRRRRRPAPRVAGWSRVTLGWRAAWSSRIWSNSRALHLEGVGRPGLAFAEGERWLELRSPGRGSTRRTSRRKPCAFISSSTPSRSSTGMLAGSSDSPTWKRGKASRSATATRSPPRARNVAAVEPPGPPPTTSTS